MNFIELLFTLKLEKQIFSAYTVNDIIKIEKRLHVEKQINSEINTVITSKLLDAVKNYPKELEAFLKMKSLVGLFLNRDNNYTEVLHNTEQFNTFFSNFIEDDLKQIVTRKIALKQYKVINNIMQFDYLFSFDFTDKIQVKLQSKLTNAYYYYANKPIAKHIEYDFLVNDSFFKLLNNFTNFTIENNIIDLYNKVVDGVNEQKKSKFLYQSLIAFASYKPQDEDLKKVFLDNRTFARNRLYDKNSYKEEKGSYKGYLTVFVVFMIIVKIAIGISRTSRPYNKNSNIEYPNFNTNNDFLDKMKLIQSTFGLEEKNLVKYLKTTKRAKNSKIKAVKNIKTGDNPFDIKFPEYNIDQYPNFVLTNKTDYDLIVLEFESFNKTRLVSAFFVKNKDSLKLSNYGDYKHTSFVFILGKKLSNYKNSNDSYAIKKLYKKDKKTPESRFLYNIKGDKVNAFYKLKNNTEIRINNSTLIVHSKGMKYSKYGLSAYTKKDVYSKILK